MKRRPKQGAKGLSSLFEEYDIVIDRKTGKILKSTPLDPERCAKFLAPFVMKAATKPEAADPEKNK